MADQAEFITRIAVNSPLRRLFDYSLPKNILDTRPTPQSLLGCRVLIPFGRRRVIGIIIEHPEQSDITADQLKAVEELIDHRPIFPPQLLSLFIWAARYYQHPAGDALFSALPTALRKGETIPQIGVAHWQLTTLGRGLSHDSLRRSPQQKALIENLLKEGQLAETTVLKLFSRAVLRSLIKKALVEKIIVSVALEPQDNIARVPALKLNSAQKTALDSINLHAFQCYLLDGVTGSGKTEIYLQLIAKNLRIGRQSLVLIPEINLTPQTQRRFIERFKVSVVTLHSGLTEKQRLMAWVAAESGEAAIVLGTRSAVFTPLRKPGLIVVDEEHDQSYKQHEGFRYSARDLAVIRGRRENIPVLLGSATPSIESLNNCHNQRYTHLTIDQRAGDAVPPEWSIIDLKSEIVDSGIAQSTRLAIEQTLFKGQQVLVFINRRGYAPTIICQQCGWSAECDYCDSRLTVHRAKQRLICHHCDYQRKIPTSCPSCHSHQLVPTGAGTERTQEYLKQIFSHVKVIRVDRDTTQRKGAMEAVISDIERAEPCILVGTQMLAKGHHFSNVTLVAVLDADTGLFSPDFRGHERLAQLLTQVAGRSGRGDSSGRVLIQTYQPQHPLLETLTREGYRAVAAQLMQQRQRNQLPPNAHIALIRAESADGLCAEEFLHRVRQLMQHIDTEQAALTLIGPLPAMLEKRANRYRFILQINAPRRSILQQSLSLLIREMEKLKYPRQLRWSVDVDPQEM